MSDHDATSDAGADAADGMPVPSDRSLLARFRAGQPDASTQLYLRYARRLQALAAKRSSAGLARRAEPEEIVQSVFRSFFRRASQGSYDVPDGTDIWNLLLVMALNKIRAAANYHHAAKRDIRRTEGGATYDRAMDVESGSDETALAMLRLVVDELLAALPDTQRAMVEMRIEGHEVAEIAAKVRRSKRSVERVLRDFREKLAPLTEGGL